MSREGDYCKCSKRRAVVCREKAITASVKRQSVVYHEKESPSRDIPLTSVVRDSLWYVTRR